MQAPTRTSLVARAAAAEEVKPASANGAAKPTNGALDFDELTDLIKCALGWGATIGAAGLALGLQCESLEYWRCPEAVWQVATPHVPTPCCLQDGA